MTEFKVGNRVRILAHSELCEDPGTHAGAEGLVVTIDPPGLMDHDGRWPINVIFDGKDETVPLSEDELELVTAGDDSEIEVLRRQLAHARNLLGRWGYFHRDKHTKLGDETKDFIREIETV